jgi:hypothetical protein
MTKTLAELRNEYRPYDTLPEFNDGFASYAEMKFSNPYDGVGAQAWDRGLECAMKAKRFGL